MIKMIKLSLVALAICGVSHAQSTVSGYVFEDANGNGKRDRREQGLAGVPVSNGVAVTVTDDLGRYTLPIGRDNIVFVVKPSGYALPVNAMNQPQYYYIHKPDGSPTLKYGGVAATGPLPKSVDFALTGRGEPSAFTALVFGDPQAYTEDEVDYFARGVVAEVEGIEGVSFGISLGDLVGDHLVLHRSYGEAVSRVGVPWYNVMGNHDMDYDAAADSLSDETFEANFGPANYAFNYGHAHFIVLDDILYPDPRDGKGYWGGYRKDQLDFVENNLKQVPTDRLIVIAQHIPLFNEGGEAFRTEDRQRLFDILKDYPNVLALSAHTHFQRQTFFTKTEGWYGAKPLHEYNAGTTSGDWYSGEFNEMGVPTSTMRDGTPKGYAYLRIDGNRYVIDYKVTGKTADEQIGLFHPKVIAHGRNPKAAIYANFYMGHEGDTVQYRIDGGAWKAMSHAPEPDPAYVWQLFRWDTAESLIPGRRPSEAVVSPHLWRAPMPAKLALGEHRIEVRATDMFGRTFTQQGAFHVAEPAVLD